MFAGRLLGEVLITGPLPLTTRGPNVEGAALGDASRGVYGGRVALENEGETLALRAAWGAVGGARGLGAGPWGGDFAVFDGAVGAVGGADGTFEGPLGGVGICGVTGTLTATVSELDASLAWDETVTGGIAGGSIRWIGGSGGGGGPGLLSRFGASLSGGRSGARSALGPVGGAVVRPEGIADLGAVGTVGVFAVVVGTTGAVEAAGPDETAGAVGTEGVGGAAEGAGAG